MTEFAFTQDHIAEIFWREVPERVRIFRRVTSVIWRGDSTIELEAFFGVSKILESPQCLPEIESVCQRWFDCEVLIVEALTGNQRMQKTM